MNILVLIDSPFEMWRIPAAHVERLRHLFPAHTFLHASDDAAALHVIGEADVAFSSRVLPEALRRATRLRWIHSPAAGVGSMLSPEMLASPVVLTNSRGIASDTIAEHVVAVLLALFRQLPRALGRQAERVWAQDELSRPPGTRMLSGSRVLLVGAGAIGSATAWRLGALGARVTAVRRRPDAAPVPGVAEVHGTGRLPDLLPAADAVVLAAPQTPLTRGLIGASALRAMRPEAVLVNVSRGGLVDEAALAGALASGQIAGAALDVFSHEPLGPDSPLWGLPNLLITPHTSGFRRDHWDAVTALFAENLRRFDTGAELLNIVDKEAGY